MEDCYFIIQPSQEKVLYMTYEYFWRLRFRFRVIWKI